MEDAAEITASLLLLVHPGGPDRALKLGSEGSPPHKALQSEEGKCFLKTKTRKDLLSHFAGRLE